MKKIFQKIFQSKNLISNWLILLIVYIMFIQFSMILDLGNTVKEQRFMRICPEPYVCVVPPENWKGKVPMGIDYYKRIFV